MQRPAPEERNECQSLEWPSKDDPNILGKGTTSVVVRRPYRGVDRSVRFGKWQPHQVELQQRAAGEHILDIVDSCVWEESKYVKRGVIIERILDGGTLGDPDTIDYFSKNKDQAKRLMDQLYDTLKHLDTFKIRHRDIHVYNIMFDKDPSKFRDWTAYLIDFGDACVAPNCDGDLSDDFLKTEDLGSVARVSQQIAAAGKGETAFGSWADVADQAASSSKRRSQEEEDEEEEDWQTSSSSKRRRTGGRRRHK
jgi:serine/threonine protein kinase